MDKFFYNKSGRVASCIARDCLILEIGDRIPTISDYCEWFDVSRGVVQNAIAFLQEEGCMQLEANGTRGTRLVSAIPEKLGFYTGWDTISVSMPLPFDLAFSSLSTAITEMLEALPVPASFAYISDPGHRLRFLEKHTFDFAVFSLSTADYYVKKSPQLDSPIILTGCTFSYPYALYTKKELRHGTKLVCDSTTHDNYTIARELTKGKGVEFVDMPYADFGSIVEHSIADAIVVRQEPWTKELLKQGYHELLLENFEDYPIKKTTIPALLTHQDNYGMNRLLKKYLDLSKLAKTQKGVLEGRRPPKFY